jgi:hypothetical protein
MQDVLDDWGNRLPMIDWDAFDRQLASRLEKEPVATATPVTRLHRWGRILAAAAALFVAATLGYTYHAMTVPTSHGDVAKVTPHLDAGPQHSVVIVEPTATGPSLDSVQYEQPQTASGDHNVVLPQSPNGTANTNTVVMGNHDGRNPGLQNMPTKTGSVVGSAGQSEKSPHGDLLQQ